jgi:hypothetical protein
MFRKILSGPRVLIVGKPQEGPLGSAGIEDYPRSMPSRMHSANRRRFQWRAAMCGRPLAAMNSKPTWARSERAFPRSTSCDSRARCESWLSPSQVRFLPQKLQASASISAVGLENIAAITSHLMPILSVSSALLGAVALSLCPAAQCPCVPSLHPGSDR